MSRQTHETVTPLSPSPAHVAAAAWQLAKHAVERLNHELDASGGEARVHDIEFWVDPAGAVNCRMSLTPEGSRFRRAPSGGLVEV